MTARDTFEIARIQRLKRWRAIWVHVAPSPLQASLSLLVQRSRGTVFNQGTIIPRRAIEPFYRIIAASSRFHPTERNVTGRSSSNDEEILFRGEGTYGAI